MTDFSAPLPQCLVYCLVVSRIVSHMSHNRCLTLFRICITMFPIIVSALASQFRISRMLSRIVSYIVSYCLALFRICLAMSPRLFHIVAHCFVCCTYCLARFLILFHPAPRCFVDCVILSRIVSYIVSYCHPLF